MVTLGFLALVSVVLLAVGARRDPDTGIRSFRLWSFDQVTQALFAIAVVVLAVQLHSVSSAAERRSREHVEIVEKLDAILAQHGGSTVSPSASPRAGPTGGETSDPPQPAPGILPRNPPPAPVSPSWVSPRPWLSRSSSPPPPRPRGPTVLCATMPVVGRVCVA